MLAGEIRMVDVSHFTNEMMIVSNKKCLSAVGRPHHNPLGNSAANGILVGPGGPTGQYGRPYNDNGQWNRPGFGNGIGPGFQGNGIGQGFQGNGIGPGI